MPVLALEIDAGAVKAAVLEVPSGTALGATVRVSYALDAPGTPGANAPGLAAVAAEVPVARLWQAVAGAARQAVRDYSSGRPGQEIDGVGLSAPAGGLVLLDKNDRPLVPVWTPLDRRSRPAARQVWAAVGEEFLREIGSRPLPGYVTALCYRQLIQDDPYLTHDVRSYLHVNGWIGLHLTGTKAFDPANASCTGLFGTVTDQAWSQKWCDFFEVDRGWLPPVVCGSTTIGTLRSEAAAELGVPAGIPVKLGGPDTAMLAAQVQEGDLLHTVAATQVLALVTQKPLPARQRLTRLLGVGSGFVHVAYNPVGDSALDWLHQLCFRDVKAEEFFGPLIEQARVRSTRVGLDPPFLAGDPLEIEAARGAFRDLELSTDRLDLLAALLHAMVKKHEEAVAALGQTFRRVVLTGKRADVVRRVLPTHEKTEILEDASLRGIAKLF